MSNLLNKEAFSRTGERLKNNYKGFGKFQKIAIFSGVGVAALLLMSLGLSRAHDKIHNSENYPIKFETVSKSTSPKQVNGSAAQLPLKPTIDFTQLQTQLNQAKQHSDREFTALRSQIEAIESSMTALASQNDVQALQNAVMHPNPIILTKVDSLQTSVQKIMQQTAKIKFVDPKTVEHEFRLVAVQGFSDGMRIIIDVNGNQTVLSLNETCPACQGWVLKKIDFAGQSAVFEKGKNVFVKLQVK